MSVASLPTLSICIATYNRGEFIGQTLDSIATQLSDECELVVLDGASTDRTEEVVLGYSSRSGYIRYIRRSENGGVDRDYDFAVQAARGKYCWLMSDDDLLKPDAVREVLAFVAEDPSLVIVNVEERNFEMTEIVRARSMDLESTRVYGPHELERLFSDICGSVLNYIGCMVLRREIWMSRVRERYYGSMFIHVGVIFQQPLPGNSVLLAKPLVCYRRGTQHSFSSRLFETFVVRLPAVVESLALSDGVKSRVCAVPPWGGVPTLLFFRAIGWYSLVEYRRFVRRHAHSVVERVGPLLAAVIPRGAINRLLTWYYLVSRHAERDSRLYELRRFLARLIKQRKVSSRNSVFHRV